MNRYDFYPGDYLRDTLTLTLAQDGAYRRLLDFYYSTERPIADEQEAFAAVRCRSEEDEKITQWVLHRFFDFTPDGFRHTKADREIEKARPKIAAARANGSRGGRPKKQLDKPTGFSVGSKIETQEQTQTEPTRNPGRKLPSPSPSLTYSSSNAGAGHRVEHPPTGGDIPCPLDLAVTDDEFAQLGLAGISREFVDAATLRFRALWVSSERRTLAKWRRTLITALTTSWSDPTRRAELLGKLPPDRKPDRRRPPGPVQPSYGSAYQQLIDQGYSEEDARAIAG